MLISFRQNPQTYLNNIPPLCCVLLPQELQACWLQAINGVFLISALLMPAHSRWNTAVTVDSINSNSYTKKKNRANLEDIGDTESPPLRPDSGYSSLPIQTFAWHALEQVLHPE